MLGRMRIPTALFMIGIGFVGVSTEVPANPVFQILLIWTSLNFGWVAFAYISKNPNLLGKRSNGTISPLHRLLLAPFFAITWILWFLSVNLTSENRCDEIFPNMWIGSRPLYGKMPPNVDLIVDLTAEFGRVPRGIYTFEYVCLPILDHSAPELKALGELVDKLKSQKGKILVHCAVGHGRSGMVIAALVIATQEAPDVAAAVDLVRKSRNAVQLNTVQMELLNNYASKLRTDQPCA